MSQINKTPVREALGWLYKAREAAEMNRMSCTPPDGTFSGPKRDEWNEQVRESTRLYRESWILGPLDMAIDALEKELAK